MISTNEEVFVLWVQRAEGTVPPITSGRIEHVTTGYRITFDSEAALLDFLRTWPPASVASELPGTSEERRYAGQ